MEDFKREIAALIAQAQTFKCRIVEAEIQSCQLALDFGCLELRLGFLETAKHWMKEAEMRSQAIPLVLPDIANGERREQFKAELDTLRTGLEALRKRLPYTSSAA